MDNLALHGGFARGCGGPRAAGASRRRETRRILAAFGVDLDIHRPLAAATPVERTVVAIAAALQGWDGDGVLVLDEPTAVLPHDEVERLFDDGDARSASAGTSVLYVSHRMDEIFDAGRPGDRAARRPRDRDVRHRQPRQPRARER